MCFTFPNRQKSVCAIAKVWKEILTVKRPALPCSFPEKTFQLSFVKQKTGPIQQILLGAGKNFSYPPHPSRFSCPENRDRARGWGEERGARETWWCVVGGGGGEPDWIIDALPCSCLLDTRHTQHTAAAMTSYWSVSSSSTFFFSSITSAYPLSSLFLFPSLSWFSIPFPLLPLSGSLSFLSFTLPLLFYGRIQLSYMQTGMNNYMMAPCC